MSRLDEHISSVRNWLAVRLFVGALAWLSVGYVSLIWIGVVVDRIFQRSLPHPTIWMIGGAIAVVGGAIGYAIYRRPSPREAAIPIDQKLGLREKLSTALYIRASSDPFAQAAVQDAEQTAKNVVLKLSEHFPISFPRPAYATCAIALAALLSYHYIQPLDFFHRRDKLAQAQLEQQKIGEAKKTVQQALATVNAMPATLADNQEIQLAKADLAALLEKPITDPATANRTAVKALQDVNEALSQQVKNSAKYAQAQNEMKMLRSMQKPVEGQGPVSDAHRAIAEGKFTEALDELDKMVENFDKLDKADQNKAAEQMKQLAQQLQQMANNPAQQQKMQQQLQQMGLNQQQAQQAQQLMQQAAQGNQQAQQQLKQMAQQAMQQMNQGQGPNPQQQQQMQQMMQQMQAQANAQNQAQQMQQAAQQMAQAMQQAAQQQGQQQQQQQPGQQGQGQGQQGNQQQMAQAMAAMQQQLGQMQAAAQDAQQIAAAQNAAQAAQANAQQAMGGGHAGGDGANIQANQQNANNGNGKWTNNNNRNFQGPNNGLGGGGIGAGDRTAKTQAPFGVKQEIDPSQDDEKGKILASNFIKDNNPLKGKSSETLKEIADKALKDQTDEIDQERIARQAQNVVKEYFKSMSKDAEGK